jgi:hypothetical protein
MMKTMLGLAGGYDASTACNNVGDRSNASVTTLILVVGSAHADLGPDTFLD